MLNEDNLIVTATATASAVLVVKLHNVYTIHFWRYAQESSLQNICNSASAIGMKGCCCLLSHNELSSLQQEINCSI